LNKKISFLLSAVLLFISGTGLLNASEDARQKVELPEMMQNHMLTSMRDHLVTINTLLILTSKGELDQAAELAESRLGMSSLGSHGAAHMAKFMPQGMQKAGTAMHKAASRFSRKAQEGEVLEAYKAIADITSACVACHSAYRIR